MSRPKICTKCLVIKTSPADFYVSQGKVRAECRLCTIKKNIIYQKKKKSWRFRFVDRDVSRQYMVEYYARNKEKFAEYRRSFRERYPTYYKLYTEKRKALNS